LSSQISDAASARAVEDQRPLVSIVLPAFNEAALLEDNFRALHTYLETLAARFRFEFLVVNDGSIDATPQIIDALARQHSNVVALHHPSNFGLGQAFKTAFAQSRGDYVVTLDIDLSYSPDHVGLLLDEISRSKAKLVLASPYMKGGRISHVPWLRRTLSIWANRFLSFFAHGNLSTLTCMVRAYDGRFVRQLVHRSTGMDIMPETVYKSMIMRAHIRQVPAHLDWSRQVAVGLKRRSSMRILRQIFATLISGFVFRPFMFFILPGLVLLAFSLWVNLWMVLHFFEQYALVAPGATPDRISAAVAAAYRLYPHTFMVGLLTLAVAVQLVSLGILALQSKNYFEELFYAVSATRERSQSPPAESASRRDN
jgi:glycosyltransferase involved in cell wall biosynthesis